MSGTLRSLRFTFCSGFLSPTTLVPSLTKLELLGRHTFSPCPEFFTALGNLTRLRSLTIGHTCWQPHVLLDVMRALQGKPLEVLDLSTSITPESASEFGELLQGFSTTLIALSIKKSDLRSSGLWTLLPVLETLKALHSLSLLDFMPRPAISPPTAARTLRLFANLPQLTKLEFEQDSGPFADVSQQVLLALLDSPYLERVAFLGHQSHMKEAKIRRLVPAHPNLETLLARFRPSAKVSNFEQRMGGAFDLF